MAIVLAKGAALSAECFCSQSEWSVVTDLQLSTGYRKDHLSWSIADPSGAPNILSELTWKNIQSWEVQATARLLIEDCIYLRGLADYGWIFQGNNQDSDYQGNHKTFEFSRSVARSEKGEVFDFNAGAGWLFELPVCDIDLKIIPLIGYAYSEQHFRDHKGVLQINSFFFELGNELPLGDLGPFPGLHSNYRAKWRSVWTGLDFAFPFGGAFQVLGSFEYHFVNYHGTGHWNLRPDFVKDFQQSASSGQGAFFSGGIFYDFCESSRAGLSATYRWMRSGSGTDKTFFDSGAEKTGFNGAVWHSWSILADLGIVF